MSRPAALARMLALGALLFLPALARADLRVFEANAPPPPDGDTSTPRFVDPVGPGEPPLEPGPTPVDPSTEPAATTEPVAEPGPEPEPEPEPAPQPLLDDHR